jgi:sensor histidine kinase YesM
MKKLVVVLIHLIFWSLIGLIHVFSWEISGLFSGGNSMWSISFCREVVVPLLLAALNFYLFYFLITTRYLMEKDFVKFFLFGTLSSVTLGVIGVIIISILGDESVDTSDLLSSIFVFTLIIFILGVCGSVMSVFFKWFSDLKYKKELEKKNLQTELALLKSQISPHFLFNTLNNIDVLITKDSEKASIYMKKLSDILRFMLYDTKNELIPMSIELEYIKKYIELQKIRTSNNSYVNFSVNGKVDEINIAPMIFIPFIENAFKHTSNKRTIDAIKIRFDFSVNSIKFNCENFKNKSDTLIQKQSGLGINLIKQRLNLLYKDKHTLKVENSEEKYFISLTIKLHEN